MEAKEIIERLLDNERLSAAEFAAKVGLRKSQISEYKSGKVKKVSATVAQKICEAFPKYSINFVLHGEGQMIKADEQNSPAIGHTAYVAEEEQQQTTTFAAASYNSIIKAQEETIRYMREELAMQQRVIDHLMAESAARTEQIAQLMTLVSKSATE